MHSSSSLLQLGVVGCTISGASARWFKGSDSSESWTPAVETPVVNYLDGSGWSPKPTSAPLAYVLEDELRRRQDKVNTCGYFSGYSSSAAVICLGDNTCIINTLESVVGCCDSAAVTDCHIVTTCIPSSAAASYSTIDYDFTRVCLSASYPYCVTYSYDRADATYGGYVAYGCGDSPGMFYTVEATAPGDTVVIAPTSSFPSSIPKSSTATSTSVPTIITTSNDNNGGGGSTTPIAPIVGGVVGGVGGIALLVAAVTLIHRRKNRKPAQPGAGGAAPYPPPSGPLPSIPGQPQHTPPMGQVYSAGAGAAAYSPNSFDTHNNRGSVAQSTYSPLSPGKSVYETTSSVVPVSPVGSPPPQTLHPHFTGASYFQQQQQPPAYNPLGVQPVHVELPTTAPQSEPRELPT
ncbi:hypothetical protein BX600DRAFT_514630 [Xylariales sp. PMI_506]|nr:hypothetical protein BX600DRAFT_514630 [Xylariales sp. PMI_506]